MELPDTNFYRAMRSGHFNRTGHALQATLDTDVSGLTRVKRYCC